MIIALCQMLQWTKQPWCVVPADLQWGKAALVADPDMIANWQQARRLVNIEIVHV